MHRLNERGLASAGSMVVHNVQPRFGSAGC